MSEYWVSQAKKYCEFCKCWIADNKPSRDFHEKGKKHQENVKKKIEEVRKSSIRAAEKEQEMNDDMREMNEKAMQAFKKDLMNDPALAKQYGIKIKSKEAERPYQGPLPRPETPPTSNPAEDSPSTHSSKEEKSEAKADTKEEGRWMMVVSEQGYPYYWNTATAEVTWVAPEAYLKQQGIPPEEYHKYTYTEASSESDKTEETHSKDTSTTDIEEPKQKKAKVEETQALIDTQNIAPADIPLPEDIPLPPEKDDTEKEESKVDSDKEEEDDQKRQEPRQPRSHQSYGTWEQVQREEDLPQVDLGLPQVKKDNQETKTIVVVNEPKMKFREKTVSTLGSGPVFFKKPKKKMTAAQFLKKREDT